MVSSVSDRLISNWTLTTYPIRVLKILFFCNLGLLTNSPKMHRFRTYIKRLQAFKSLIKYVYRFSVFSQVYDPIK